MGIVVPINSVNQQHGVQRRPYMRSAVVSPALKPLINEAARLLQAELDHEIDGSIVATWFNGRFKGAFRIDHDHVCWIPAGFLQPSYCYPLEGLDAAAIAAAVSGQRTDKARETSQGNEGKEATVDSDQPTTGKRTMRGAKYVSDRIRLESMPLSDLLDLQRLVSAAISRRRLVARARLRNRLASIASQSGFSLEEVVFGTKRPKRSVPVRYRNTANPEEVWSGRGKMAGWLRREIEINGAKLEDFLVNDQIIRQDHHGGTGDV